MQLHWHVKLDEGGNGSQQLSVVSQFAGYICAPALAVELVLGLPVELETALVGEPEELDQVPLAADPDDEGDVVGATHKHISSCNAQVQSFAYRLRNCRVVARTFERWCSRRNLLAQTTEG